jgi:membrane protease YdiL (CAAX protease family)
VKFTLLAILVVAVSTGVALNPWLVEAWQTWTALIVPYLALTVLALRDLHSRQLLRARLMPRGGDVSIGILLGLLMAALGIVAQRALVPTDSANAEWLFTLYAQVGNVQRDPVSLAALAALVAMEEIVWRSMVLDGLERDLGRRWAAPAAAAAYALAHLPTLWTLAGQSAGPNPLLVLAAFGCGVCWVYLVSNLGRLWPAFASHLVFTYFMAAPLPSWLPRWLP